VAPRVLGGFLFADLFVPDGVGDALVVAAAVVAVVPCCCVQETTNAVPTKAVISKNTYFFISSVRAPENVWLLGTECTVASKQGQIAKTFTRAVAPDNRVTAHINPYGASRAFLETYPGITRS
jgi:hypothetical protein